MKRIVTFLLIILAVAGIEMCAMRPAYAGVAGWVFQWWDCCGSNTTVVNSVNWNNVGTGSGYHNYLSGYVKWPGTAGTAKTIAFAAGYDDGHTLKANGVTVASGPCCGWAYGSVTANPGDIVKLEFWSDNYGGGPYTGIVMWDPQGDGTYELVTGASIATTADYWVPVLAGGASSSAFINTPANTAKVTVFTSRTTADSQIYIEQIGNSNTITVNQSGTKNNYANYYSNGSSNNATITQSSTSATAVNYTELKIVGNQNTANITQQSTGGTKSAFVTINNSNNSVLLTQKDSGSHSAEITLAGGNKNVDVLQQGSGNHQAKVGLTGLPVDLSLSQSGSTQQSYSINFNCATAGGCQKISVSQGQ